MTLDYYKVQLKKTAEQLSEKGKGILAVDESTKTIGKRLFDINVENTEENRQAYRGMLFTTPDLGKSISGAILFEETLYQNHADGESMVDKLIKQGIIPGIKVDKGLKPLP
jgi:fructose-bisphosphate aldolase class I